MREPRVLRNINLGLVAGTVRVPRLVALRHPAATFRENSAKRFRGTWINHARLVRQR